MSQQKKPGADIPPPASNPSNPSTHSKLGDHRVAQIQAEAANNAPRRAHAADIFTTVSWAARTSLASMSRDSPPARALVRIPS